MSLCKLTWIKSLCKKIGRNAGGSNSHYKELMDAYFCKDSFALVVPLSQTLPEAHCEGPHLGAPVQQSASDEQGDSLQAGGALFFRVGGPIDGES